jgi:hypothetical protein
VGTIPFDAFGAPGWEPRTRRASEATAAGRAAGGAAAGSPASGGPAAASNGADGRRGHD